MTRADDEQRGFWQKHGGNMVSTLILGSTVAVFTLFWSIQEDMGAIRVEVMQAVNDSKRNSLRVDSNSQQISNISSNYVSRTELSMSVQRIERIMERIEDKLENRTNGHTK